MTTGDGQNRFKYDATTTDQFTINFKAKVTPAGVDLTKLKDQITFTIENVGAITPTWGPNNPGGKSSISGSDLIATATFSGLPTKNSHFGNKKVELNCKGSLVEMGNVQVFYSALKTNHPGGVPTDPNWFYYYKDQEGGTDYVYDGTLPMGRSQTVIGVRGSQRIGSTAYSGGGYVTTAIDASGMLKATFATGGILSSAYSYWQYFSGVILHEREHANHQTSAHAPTDRDDDQLDNNFEVNISKTDPDKKYSAIGLSDADALANHFTEYFDGEVYAGGPIEEAGIKGADIKVDWAQPGNQWP